MKARQLFFSLFAKEKGFDPLVPENWYSVPSEELLSSKVCWVGFGARLAPYPPAHAVLKEH